MNRKLTEKQLKRFYRLLSVPMTDFDCGSKCAPDNDGVPYCCDREQVTPVLFRDEYRWHREQGTFWKKMPIKTKQEKKLVEETCTYNVFSLCPGVKNCRRTLRSLSCRMFPFEPFLDKKGSVIGLVYQDGDNERCPLIGKSRRFYNQAYISNAIRVWQELVDTFPEEKEMYLRESRRRKRLATRTGKPLTIFK
jgi:hypothetical protein